MDNFYTYVGQHFDHILVSGYENGIKFNRKIPYKPFLFVPGNGEYSTVDGKKLARVDFESIKEARDFSKRYAEVANFKIYGLANFPYVYLYENYKKMKVNPRQIRVGNLDIETDSQNGFGNIQLADREIVSITLKVLREKDIYVFGLKEYSTQEPELKAMLEKGYSINYVQCDSEAMLLRRFIKVWRHLELDATMGWNSKMFDIPYIIKRIKQTLTEKDALKLSPFERIDKGEVPMFGRVLDVFTICGVPHLDYIEVYQKFSTPANGREESYALNYISNKILKATKLDYSEYKTLAALYNQNFNKFIDYNIIDVLRVEQLEEYLRYLELVFTIAYFAGINYEDTFGTIRPWDIMIHNYLMDRKIAIPTNVRNTKERQIAGGHVKDPQVGRHEHVISFDFTSLYPHLVMAFNISPETLLGSFDPIVGDYSVDKILANELEQYVDEMVENNVTVSGRGTVFSREKQGFIPALMQELFAERKRYTAIEEAADAKLAPILTEIECRGIKTK